MTDGKMPRRQEVEIVKDAIIKLHNIIIKKSGGLDGIRDIGGIENTAYNIVKSIVKNENPITTAAKIYKELAGRHHFNDGNKRIAHVMAKVFLISSGLYLKIHYKEAVVFIMSIADHGNKVSVGDIKKWIEKDLTQISEDEMEFYIDETSNDIRE